jgi:hypothetical protein
MIALSPIAHLNDLLRTTFMGGRVMMTAAVSALPEHTRANILTAVRNFANFNKDNDPHGEHDCALFDVDEHRCMFKIDYYDLSLEYGSEDPADPKVTTRVLTIMLASDY